MKDIIAPLYFTSSESCLKSEFAVCSEFDHGGDALITISKTSSTKASDSGSSHRKSKFILSREKRKGFDSAASVVRYSKMNRLSREQADRSSIP